MQFYQFSADQLTAIADAVALFASLPQSLVIWESDGARSVQYSHDGWPEDKEPLHITPNTLRTLPTHTAKPSWRVRDVVLNAVQLKLALLCGECQLEVPDYEPLRSAWFALSDFDPRLPLAQRLAGCTHPPTGRLLKPWVLTKQEHDAAWSSGLAALARDIDPSRPEAVRAKINLA